VLPGVIPPIAPHWGAIPPLIAGGLIRTRAQVEEILAAGAVGVSTGEAALWGFRANKEQANR
jgi:glycerol-3-phosphate responsive antiterminator